MEARVSLVELFCETLSQIVALKIKVSDAKTSSALGDFTLWHDRSVFVPSSIRTPAMEGLCPLTPLRAMSPPTGSRNGHAHAYVYL